MEAPHRSHHLAKFDGQRPCTGRYITYLICYVTSYDHVFRELYEFIRGSHLWQLTTLSSLMAIGLTIIEITHLICHVNLQDHVIKGSCDFMEGNSSLRVTVLSNLVAVNIVAVEIKHVCHVTLPDHVIKGSC